jgi:hypothetical protein
MDVYPSATPVTLCIISTKCYCISLSHDRGAQGFTAQGLWAFEYVRQMSSPDMLEGNYLVVERWLEPEGVRKCGIEGHPHG